MPTLLEYLALVNALLCLGMGLYVLSRNWRKLANASFFAGMAALGMTELGLFLGGSPYHGIYVFPSDRIAGAGEILLPGAWLLFSLSFARADASLSVRRWRYPLEANADSRNVTPSPRAARHAPRRPRTAARQDETGKSADVADVHARRGKRRGAARPAATTGG